MRYDLTDFEWSIIEPVLPMDRRGPKPRDNRRVLNGIFWVLRTAAPWRDLPERYGPYTTAYNRFNRWRKDGIWDRLMDAIVKAYDGKVQMIDSSIVRGLLGALDRHSSCAWRVRPSRQTSSGLRQVRLTRIPRLRSDPDQRRPVEQWPELRTGGLEDNFLNVVRIRPAHHVRSLFGTVDSIEARLGCRIHQCFRLAGCHRATDILNLELDRITALGLQLPRFVDARGSRG